MFRRKPPEIELPHSYYNKYGRLTFPRPEVKCETPYENGYALGRRGKKMFVPVFIALEDKEIWVLGYLDGKGDADS